MTHRTSAPIRLPRAFYGFFLFLLFLLCHLHEPARAASDPPIPSGDVRIHYFRPDGNYSGWAIYTWNAHPTPGWCSGEVQVTGTDSFGVYFDVPVDTSLSTDLGFIINNCPAGGIKDPGPDQHLNIATYNEAWVIHADATVFTTQPTPSSASRRFIGSIAHAWRLSLSTPRPAVPMHWSLASRAV